MHPNPLPLPPARKPERRLTVIVEYDDGDDQTRAARCEAELRRALRSRRRR